MPNPMNQDPILLIPEAWRHSALTDIGIDPSTLYRKLNRYGIEA